MRAMMLGALALAVSAPVAAQSTDLTYAVPIAGGWRYSAVAAGSEANFVSVAGLPQLTVRCTHLTRSITITKPAPIAASSLWVWTSLQSRSLPAAFDATALRASATLSAFDALTDAMASSRGRLGFSTPGVPTLVVPAGGEVARVVEDCRA